MEPIPLNDDLFTDQPDHLGCALDERFAVIAHERALAKVRDHWNTSERTNAIEALAQYVLRSPEPGEYADVARQLGLPERRIKRLVFDLREDHYEAFRHEVARTTLPEQLDDELRYLVTLLIKDH